MEQPRDLDLEQPPELLEALPAEERLSVLERTHRAVVTVGDLARSVCELLRRTTVGSAPSPLLAVHVAGLSDAVAAAQPGVEAVGVYFVRARIRLAEIGGTDPLVRLGPAHGASHHHAVAALGRTLLATIAGSVPKLATLLPKRAALQDVLSREYPQLAAAVQSGAWELGPELEVIDARLLLEQVRAGELLHVDVRSGYVPEALLRGRQTSASARPFDDVILHDARSIVGRNGYRETVKLRPQHWALFARLLEAGGDLVPNEDLIRVGWPGQRPTANALNYAVATLSQRLRPLDLDVGTVRDAGRRLVHRRVAPF